jgi:hypothetical protein
MLECLYMRHWVVFYCLIVSIFRYTAWMVGLIDTYWIAFIWSSSPLPPSSSISSSSSSYSYSYSSIFSSSSLWYYHHTHTHTQTHWYHHLIDIIIIIILIDLVIIISLISSSLSFLSNVGEVIGEFQQKLLIFTNNSRTSNAVLEINYKAVGR